MRSNDRSPTPYDAAVRLYRRKKWKEALEAFQRLAEAGNVLAQVAIGNMYAAGRGVPRDLAEAARWLERAAALGNPAAKYALARLRQLQDNHQAARALFVAAASDGYFPALYWIGICCELGLGTKRDLARAISNYRKAADLGHVPARARLGRLGLSGHFGVSGRMKGIWLSATALLCAFRLVLISANDLRIVR